jgi:hypothetical protein
MRILTTEDGPGAGPARHRGPRGRVVSVPAVGITALLTTSAGLAWAIIQSPLPTLQFCYTAYFGVQATAGSPGQAPADYRSLRAPSCT